MNDISGPKCSGSSASADLARSLASRLQTRLPGSMESHLTWKGLVTPSGRVLFRLVPSTRRTGATGFGLWATPRSSDGAKGGPNMAFSAGGQPLPAQAYWATPAARDSRFPNALPFRERGGGKKGEQLNNQAAHFGTEPSGSPAVTEKRGALNPQFVSWLMGYSPTAWVSCGASVTRSSRRSRRSS